MDVGTPLKFNNQGEGAAILGLFGMANIFKQDFLGMDRRVIRRKFGMEWSELLVKDEWFEFVCEEMSWIVTGLKQTGRQKHEMKIESCEFRKT